MDDYAQRLPYLMRVTSNALSQQLERALRPFGLTHAQLAALAQLTHPEANGLSSAELGYRAGVTPQSMSTAVASLLERGLIQRTPHPTHGRVLEVRITPAGAELCKSAQIATKSVETRAVAGLTPDQQSELRLSLRHMMTVLGLFVPA